MTLQVLPGLDRAMRVAVLAVACLYGCGQGTPEDMPSCVGAKCDDPGGISALHLSAVLDCDRIYEGAKGQAGSSSADLLVAEKSYRQCLITANDSVIPVIDDNLQSSAGPERSREEIATVMDEFRYASLCSDVESASAETDTDLDLVVQHCESSRERNLAVLIDGLVDFTGQRIEVVFGEARDTFSACYDAYDRDLAASVTPAQSYQARQQLAACAADSLRADAEILKDRRCELETCNDELLVLSFVQAGYETAISTTDRACDLLVDASIYRDGGDPEQVLDCRLAGYAGLRSAVAAGLGL